MQIFSGKISFTYFAFIFINQPRCMVGTLDTDAYFLCNVCYTGVGTTKRGSECQKNYCEQKKIWLCVTLTNRPRTVRFLSLKYFISRPNARCSEKWDKIDHNLLRNDSQKVCMCVRTKKRAANDDGDDGWEQFSLTFTLPTIEKFNF